MGLGDAFAGGLAADEAVTRAEGLVIEVLFQDYAGVPDRLLDKAVTVAAEQYESAGVEIEWLDCTPALRGLPAPAACTSGLRPTKLFIQLLPEKMAKGLPTPRSVFGFAVPGTDTRLASRASLFWDRIRDYCEAFALDPDALLGMALAHEIGHLLLPERGHSERGLMRCPWKKQEVVDAARGRLRFTPSQIARVREGALERASAAKTELAPVSTNQRNSLNAHGLARPSPHGVLRLRPPSTISGRPGSRASGI